MVDSTQQNVGKRLPITSQTKFLADVMALAGAADLGLCVVSGDSVSTFVIGWFSMMAIYYSGALRAMPMGR